MAKLRADQGVSMTIKATLDHTMHELEESLDRMGAQSLASMADDLAKDVSAESMGVFRGLKLQQAKWVQRQLDALAAMGGADAVADAAGMGRLQFTLDEEATEPGLLVVLLDSNDPTRAYPIAHAFEGTLEGFVQRLQAAVLGDENERLLAEADALLKGL